MHFTKLTFCYYCDKINKMMQRGVYYGNRKKKVLRRINKF